MAKDKCVLCGKETPYDETTHIDNRRGYYEGCGQTCPDGCDTDTDIDTVIEKLLDTEWDDVPGSDTHKEEQEPCKLEDGRTGYELFRYVKPEETHRPKEWKTIIFWVVTIAVTWAICVFITYSLCKIFWI